MNTVFANISKTISPTSDSFLLIISHDLHENFGWYNALLRVNKWMDISHIILTWELIDFVQVNPTNMDVIWLLCQILTKSGMCFTKLFNAEVLEVLETLCRIFFVDFVNLQWVTWNWFPCYFKSWHIHEIRDVFHKAL